MKRDTNLKQIIALGLCCATFLTAAGCSSDDPAEPGNDPAVTVTLTAEPGTIDAGATATLTWSSTNAASCTSDHFATNDQTAGTVQVQPTATTDYVITGSGPGETATATATVSVRAALPADYFVDPQTGDDANSGESVDAPWRTLPGTAGGSSWGAVDASNRIEAGEIIELKAGGTLDSSHGGRLVVDATYYEAGTPAAPIVIRVSSTWGSGDFIYDGAGMSVPQYQGLVFLRIDHLELRGAGPDRRFVVQDTEGSQTYNILVYGTPQAAQTGMVMEWIESRRGVYAGIGVGYAVDGSLANSLVHGADLGVSVGLAADVFVDGWTFTDLDIYENGLNSTGYEGLPHGMQVVGASNVLIDRCRSHGNRRDGFDFGSASAQNDGDLSVTVTNTSSYDNGEDGFGVNAGTGNVVVDYINVVAFNNANGWQIYDGPQVGIYHSVAYNNGQGPSFGGNILTYTASGVTRITLRNNIFYKPRDFAHIASYDSPAGQPVIDSDFNMYVPRAADDEVGFEMPWGVTHTYSVPPAFIGPNDRVGIAWDPRFTATSTTDFAANDLHLTAGSDALDAGTYLASPAEVLTDRDGAPRADPPDLGLYESGGGGR